MTPSDRNFYGFWPALGIAALAVSFSAFKTDPEAVTRIRQDKTTIKAALDGILVQANPEQAKQVRAELLKTIGRNFSDRVSYQRQPKSDDLKGVADMINNDVDVELSFGVINKDNQKKVASVLGDINRVYVKYGFKQAGIAG